MHVCSRSTPSVVRPPAAKDKNRKNAQTPLDALFEQWLMRLDLP
jgi:hypothetical protein